MNQAAALQRLEALEAQARLAELEQSRHDPQLRAQAGGIAVRSGLDVDDVIEESIEIARHIAEVGLDESNAVNLTIIGWPYPVIRPQ